LIGRICLEEFIVATYKLVGSDLVINHRYCDMNMCLVVPQ
jgi:hypothetical protein